MHKNFDGYTLNHAQAYALLTYTLSCTHIYFIIIIEIIEHLKLCQPKV